MASSLTETVTHTAEEKQPKLLASSLREKAAAITTSTLIHGRRQPLRLSGALDEFKSFDVAPVIGREFENADLAAWLEAPNSDELLRDLAITVSQRGVVFFRAQDKLTNDLQKQLAQRLGELSGKPLTSKLHIHPISNSGRELGGEDDEISVISSVQAKKIYKNNTLWASGYELYDRISKPYQKFLESLTATYAQPKFNETASKNGFQVYSEARDAPENVGEELEAIHPVIRTNPVTGWKSVFAVGHHVQRINGVTDLESKALLDWFVRLIVDNHDLQVRHRWQNPNDLAIWDNRSVYHVATPDYLDQGLGERTGQRAISLGERPYLDPQSTGRREALTAVKR